MTTNIQIPALPAILDSQREEDDLFVLRDVTDGFDRKITHRQLLNLFKNAGNYSFVTDDTLTVGDFGVGRTAIALNNLASEYLALGVGNDMTTLVTGVFKGDPTTISKPTKVAGSFFHILNIKDGNPNSDTQLTFGIQSTDGVNSRGQVTNIRMFVKSLGDSAGEQTVAYAEETYTKQEIDNMITSLVQDQLYPVGSVYTSLDANSPSPAVTLGFGSWVPIQGKVIVGQGGNPLFATAGSSGGALSNDYTQGSGNITNTLSVNSTSLTTSQIPSHTHNLVSNTSLERMFYTRFKSGSVSPLTGRFDIDGDSGNDARLGFGRDNDVDTIVETTTSQSTGGSQGHTHSLSGAIALQSISTVQPYIVAKLWQRTA